MSSSVLLSTAYLPPVRYVCQFLVYDQVFIEMHENYQKQSYRNRCYIYGANGKQCLVIPVVKNHGTKTVIADVMIDYSMPWQKNHLKSIESAYKLSPFYEYYADDFTELFNHQPKTLVEWNLRLLKGILALLGIKKLPSPTLRWEKLPLDQSDYRQSIHPKDRLNRDVMPYQTIAYQQVFAERFGFLPDLSIIDLLFNEGPQALSVMTKSINNL